MCHVESMLYFPSIWFSVQVIASPLLPRNDLWAHYYQLWFKVSCQLNPKEWLCGSGYCCTISICNYQMLQGWVCSFNFSEPRPRDIWRSFSFPFLDELIWYLKLPVLRWWDCIALPDDVEPSNEVAFRMQIREMAFTVNNFLCRDS